MSDTQLTNELTAFSRWKQRQRKTLQQLGPWLKKQGLYTAEAHRAIERAHHALASDTITVAVAGEFSRGKTELINALFFHDFQRRLLPTDAGRTTMCPTEIYQDDSLEPHLRLLPIESRLGDDSLHKLRLTSEAWIEQALELDNLDTLEAQLSEITASRKVPVNEAVRLGLYRAEQASGILLEDELVEIPRWRLAQINFRHPLLAKGLRILDTPGLNAVGNEPELTYEMLPSAQAILFVVGADTGVTRSDLEMWQQFIKRPGGQRSPGLMVVLNKADTLWDELRPERDVRQTINRQCAEVARILDIGTHQVFPASAQKGLFSRIQKDRQLEENSGIARVEKHLSDVMVKNRRDLIMSEYTENVQSALEALEHIVNGRLGRIDEQTDGLNRMGGESDNNLAHMLRETQTHKHQYQASLETYRDSRTSFANLGQVLMTALDVGSLEKVIDQAHHQMSGAWTTFGLKMAMRTLFDDIKNRMETVSTQIQSMRRLVRSIYRHFKTHHNFSELDPPMFSIVKYQVELSLLQQEADVFRNSARVVITEQHFVVARYFNTIVNRVLSIFRLANEDAQQWLSHALDPLTLAIKEHRGTISQQIQDLKLAGQSRKTIHLRLHKLSRDRQRLEQQLDSLRNVRETLGNQHMPDVDGRVKPRLISNTNEPALA